MDTRIGSQAEAIVGLLEQMRLKAPDIEASAVVSTDGLLMASILPRGIDEDVVSAMSAAMLSLGSRIVHELDRGELNQIFLDGDKGTAILMSVRDGAVLTTLARPKAQLGLVLVAMRHAVSQLAQLI